MLERLEAALIKPASVLCSWSSEWKSGWLFIAVHYLRIFMSSSHQNFLLILDHVCARSRVCMCVRVCAGVGGVKQHYRMIEIFKGTLPGELFVGLTFH